MPRPKGIPKTGGRTKGTPNKVTQEMRDIVRQAFEGAGGVEYLIEQSAENPTAFMTLVGKLVPNQVEADVKTSTVLKIIDLSDS